MNAFFEDGAYFCPALYFEAGYSKDLLDKLDDNLSSSTLFHWKHDGNEQID